MTSPDTSHIPGTNECPRTNEGSDADEASNAVEVRGTEEGPGGANQGGRLQPSLEGPKAGVYFGVLATFTPKGYPVANPLLVYFDPSSRSFLSSSSIAYSKKVANLRQFPRAVLWIRPRRLSYSYEATSTASGPDQLSVWGSASIAQMDFEQALSVVGSYFREVGIQPSLRSKLERSRLWRRLYAPYFSRYLISLKPEEVWQGGWNPGTASYSPEVDEEKPRAARVRKAVRGTRERGERASKAATRKGLGLVESIAIRRLPEAVAVLSTQDDTGLRIGYAGRCVVVATSRNQVTVKLDGAAPCPTASSSNGRPEGRSLHCKASLATYYHSEDLSTLVQVTVVGEAQVDGRYAELEVVSRLCTWRLPGFFGDLWTGLDSYRRGLRISRETGVEPVSSSVLDMAFGGKKR